MNAIVLTWNAVQQSEEELTSALSSSGVWGFAVTAIFALLVVFLGLSLVRHLRTSTYRRQIREALADEMAANEVARDGGIRAQHSPGASPVSDISDEGAGGDLQTDRP